MQIVFIFFIFLITPIQNDVKIHLEWINYLQKYDLNRFMMSENAKEIWLANKRFIEEHNNKNVGFVLQINKFAHLSDEEFAQLYLSPIETINFREESGTNYHRRLSLPQNVNWIEMGAVTPVKDQKNCGSCWAFSATGAIESRNFIKNKKLLLLSEQQLVDCSRNYGNQGCDGGFMNYAFEYVTNEGLTDEKSYPYAAIVKKCRAANMSSVVKVRGFKQIENGNEYQLTEEIAKGPVSVAIDASDKNFRFYSSGIFYSYECSSIRLNHAVLAVGYGTFGFYKNFYRIKNSFGSDWGNKGYILMSRNSNNNCGIASQASFPIIA